MICTNKACRREIHGGPCVIEQGQRLPGGEIAATDLRYCSDSCAQDDMTRRAARLASV